MLVKLIHIIRYYALVGTLTMAFVGGYTVFLPGNWDVPSFLFSYTMIGVYPILFISWKIVHKTEVCKMLFIPLQCSPDRDQWRNLEEVDFFEKERHQIDQYEHADD